MKEIKIKYQEGVQHIEPLKVGDWFDLVCAQDVFMKAGEHKLIPLGVAMQLPDGYEAHIAPRSSTYKKYGLIQTNCPGIVDNSYCGDEDWWFWSVVADRDTSVPKNTRVCQFRIVEKQPEVTFIEVEKLGNENRGGCGSTGN